METCGMQFIGRIYGKLVDWFNSGMFQMYLGLWNIANWCLVYK